MTAPAARLDAYLVEGETPVRARCCQPRCRGVFGEYVDADERPEVVFALQPIYVKHDDQDGVIWEEPRRRRERSQRGVGRSEHHLKNPTLPMYINFSEAPPIFTRNGDGPRDAPPATASTDKVVFGPRGVEGEPRMLAMEELPVRVRCARCDWVSTLPRAALAPHSV